MFYKPLDTLDKVEKVTQVLETYNLMKLSILNWKLIHNTEHFQSNRKYAYSILYSCRTTLVIKHVYYKTS